MDGLEVGHDCTGVDMFEMLELGYMMGRWSTDTAMNMSAVTAQVHACRSIEVSRNFSRTVESKG